MPPHILSKTSFLKFEQCPKAFYFYKSMPFFKDPVTPERQLAFRRGHDVGRFARQLFPGGVDISELTDDKALALEFTAQHIASKTAVLYEATFMYNGVLVMVDILRRDKDRYFAYEVKSALRVSEVFIRDGCLQYYVLRHSLPGFDDLFLVTMNPDYVKNGDIEPKHLFRKRSIKEKAEENFSYFDFQVNAAHLVVEENKIPNIPVGPQCFKPYQCDYFNICWKDQLSEKSVFHMPHTNREKQFEWHRAGLKLIDQVPDEVLQKDSLVKIKNAFRTSEPFFDLPAISAFLSKVTGAVCAMDMEVWNPAIPVLDGTRPFEQVPFMVGITDGSEDTYHFCRHESDEREEFARALIRLTAPFDTVLVYDRNLELAVVGSLAQKFPALEKELRCLSSKLADIFEVFMNLHYYHPAFRNSFSLKATAAALLPDLNYGEIGSGLEAMGWFDQYRSERNEISRQLLFESLVRYCLTDCIATLGLYNFLLTLVGVNAGTNEKPSAREGS